MQLQIQFQEIRWHLEAKRGSLPYLDKVNACKVNGLPWQIVTPFRICIHS